ncbi:MAG: zinc-dependent metalloprotease [Actinobacteria bacterium]|nr:zinc-dependent metalloprotease [Actinomycetota bacterium]
MSTPGPYGGNPFEGMPIFGDIARMFQNQGPVNWDVARQLGGYMASEGKDEGNVDPLERIRLAELARVAELQVAQATGLSTSITGRALTIRPTTRGEWAAATLEAYKPLFERLAASLGSRALHDPALGEPEDAERGGPMSEAMLGNIFSVMAPVILGMQLGHMVGHLARRSFGQYDLPIPRPPADDLLVVAANLDEFASDWSLPPDDLRLWVCLDSVTHHAVLGRAHVRARLEELLHAFAGGFAPDPSALTDRLTEIDPTDQQSWEQVFGDPDSLLGSIESPEQRSLKPHLEALTAAIEGYVDYVMDDVGGRLIGSYGSIAEAVRRRRVEANKGDRLVGGLFGLELRQAQYDRGGDFVRGIVERTGGEGVTRLWESPRDLPTPAEVDAPGLWWERINLPE